MKTLFSVFLSFLLAISMPGKSFSQMGEAPLKENMDHMIGIYIDYAKEIGLTNEQITKMKAINYKSEKNQSQFVSELKIAEIEFVQIMDKKDFDMEKASSIVKNIEGIKTTRHLEMLSEIKEIRAILTKEQFLKMNKIKPLKPYVEKSGKNMMKK